MYSVDHIVFQVFVFFRRRNIKIVGSTVEFSRRFFFLAFVSRFMHTGKSLKYRTSVCRLLGSAVSFQVSMIKFRTSVFLTSFDLFVLLSRNNLSLVGKFVSVENCLLSRIAHVYTAKTIVLPAIISQGRTRWCERGRTAFSGPAHVNPSGPTHVSFHYGFL